MPEKITIIGHRGSGAGVSSSGLKENTLASFASAFAYGCDEVELDLALTADGEIVVYHDEYLKVPGSRVKIHSVTLNQMKSIDPDIPALDEVMEAFPKKFFTAEIKSHSPWPEIIARLAGKPYWPDSERIKIISFNPEALLMVKRDYQAVYGNLIATATEPKFSPWVTQRHIRWCVDHGIEEISGQTWLFSARMIDRARDAGLITGLGMIDSDRALSKALKTKVTRLYTNRAEWLKKSLPLVIGKNP